MKTFLHVGCGNSNKSRTTAAFAGDDWQELRFDINEAVHPDIVGNMLDMNAVATESVDAVFSSHNIEHLYPHEVPVALGEFFRVLKPGGFAVITCPDLQSIAALIAEDKLGEQAYVSPSGPITPLDMVYGYRPQLAAGNLFMAHHCGFTVKVLGHTLLSCGFKSIANSRRAARFDLWTLATKLPMPDAELLQLAGKHLPE